VFLWANNANVMKVTLILADYAAALCAVLEGAQSSRERRATG